METNFIHDSYELIIIKFQGHEHREFDDAAAAMRYVNSDQSEVPRIYSMGGLITPDELAEMF